MQISELNSLFHRPLVHAKDAGLADLFKKVLLNKTRDRRQCVPLQVGGDVDLLQALPVRYLRYCLMRVRNIMIGQKKYCSLLKILDLIKLR